MPNYLQRILISGARTTSQAKPPYSAAPVPGIVPAWRPPVEAGLPLAEEMSSDLEMPAPASVVPAKPSETAVHETATRESRLTTPSPIAGSRKQQPLEQREKTDLAASSVPMAPPSSAGALVQAPKELRRSVSASKGRQEVARITEQMLRTLPARQGATPPETGTTTPETTGEPPSRFEGASKLGVSKAAFSQVQRKPLAASLPVQSSATPSADAQGPAQARANKIEAGEVTAGERPPATARPSGVPVAANYEVVVPAGSEEPPKPSAGPSRSDVTLPGRPVPRPETEQQSGDRRVFDVQATPPRKAVLPAVPGPTPDRRKGQISIGRIDLQVNNLPASDDPSPPSVRPPIHTNFLEARYLNRFPLKP